MTDAKPDAKPEPYTVDSGEAGYWAIESGSAPGPAMAFRDKLEAEGWSEMLNEAYAAGVASANERNEAQWLEASRRLNVLYARSSAEGGLYLEEVQRIIDEERGKA